MARFVKIVIQYLFIIGLMGVLVWVSLRALHVPGSNKWDYLWQAWERTNKLFLYITAIFLLLSHYIRAVRWKILLLSSNNQIRVSYGFLAIMIGYLVNLVIPRGGEVSRCYYLRKLEKTPIEISFGTIVIERIIDILCMLTLIGLAFFIEWDSLYAFMGQLPISLDHWTSAWKWILAGLLIVMVGIWGIYRLRKNETFQKIIFGFKGGLMSVFRLEKKWPFITYSILIWVAYFLMTWFTLQSFKETSMLGATAVLVILVLSSIAMVIPLPGGTGSYHTILPLGLVALYHIPQSDAIVFVFIFHAWYTLINIVFGALCLLITYFFIQWNRHITRSSP